MVHFSLVLGLLTACAPLSAASPVATQEYAPTGTHVNIRIEGNSSTIFEGIVKTSGHNVTTASGGTHHCELFSNFLPTAFLG
jgi:hypothetical protein